MVENSQDEPPGASQADWSALYELWRGGAPPGQLADAFDISESVLVERCRWLDEAFPAQAPFTLRRQFMVQLHEAQAALEAKPPLEAERRAKALIALIRAARALEDWSQPEPAVSAAQETRGEPFDVKAELKRVLLERFRRERAAEGGRPDVDETGLRGAGGEQPLA